MTAASFVIDCLQSPSTDSMRAAGVVGVTRYLSWPDRDSLGKVIHQAEYDRLVAASFGVVLNWEWSARDWTGGASAGAVHAAEAVRQADALGYPRGHGIYGSADFNMTSTDWSDTAGQYAAAFAAGVRGGGYRPGVYGPWDALQWVHDAGYMDLFWQAGMSTSWSGGRNANPWPGAHLRQRHQITIGGADCDYNDILAPDYGQYGGTMTTLDDTWKSPVDGQVRTLAQLLRDLHDDLVVGGAGPAWRRDAGLMATVAATHAQTTALATAAPPTAAVTLSDTDRTSIVADLQTALGGATARLEGKVDELLAVLRAGAQAQTAALTQPPTT